MNRQEEGLYSLFIHNGDTKDLTVLTTGIRDEEFVRGKIPMTKEEVRTVSIAKLGLTKDAIVYDVGSGTGSVAVEIARLGVKQVYAVEKNPQAIALIKENIKKFKLTNVTVIPGEAPDALCNLPAPTHVFVGGSGGKMKKILSKVKGKNNSASVVINAVSFETLNECIQAEKEFDIIDFDIISLAVTRTNQVGNYHMMKSENQIFICSFKFDGDR